MSLPHRKIAKHFEGRRVKRAIIKIVRGLYFHSYGTVLPADVLSVVQIVSPGEKPPDHFFAALGDKDGKGQYPGVLGYKFAKFSEANNLHYWALLFWDRIIAIATFHDPLCQCSGWQAQIKGRLSARPQVDTMSSHLTTIKQRMRGGAHAAGG